MTPRVQMVTIPHDVTIDAAAEIIRQNPHTRFPIVKGTPDQVLGFVHSRDVLLAFEQEKEAADIKDILRPALQVPKQMRLDHLMREFQKKQTHMAVVLDEYGGTEGIVTFEDVIEELVGEIADEHDVNEHLIQRINKRTIIAAADEEVRSVNQFFNVAIPGDPLATLAEVLLDNLQTAPRTGMQVSFENVMCTIESVKKGVIEKVKIEKT